jgi:hypothetical protein
VVVGMISLADIVFGRPDEERGNAHGHKARCIVPPADAGMSHIKFGGGRCRWKDAHERIVSELVRFLAQPPAVD